MRNINRRESPRIEIQLWCHVTSPALWTHSAMFTENISRNGMLVAWRGENGPLPPPALGQIITIEVELPAHHGFGQKCMHVQGTVLRVSDAGANYPRVALRVNYMDFRSFHMRLSAMDALQPEAEPWMA
jgi:PilZ domain